MDVYVTKGIDASFVSAVMDAALTVFAFIALVEARKMWIQRAKEDGYKIALDLLNYKFINSVMSPGLNDWIQQTETLYYQHKRLKGIKTKHLHTSEVERIKNETCSFIKKLTSCYQTVDESFQERVVPLNKEIQFDFFRMRNAGVDFSSDKHGKFLYDHFMKFSLLSQKINALCSILNGYILTHDENKYSEEILKLNEDINEEYDSLEVAFKEFFEIKDLICLLRDNLNKATNLKEVDIHSYFTFN
ncbi:TPA: hypothetical protein ACXDFY_004469 [Enterobacter roggenkampii]